MRKIFILTTFLFNSSYLSAQLERISGTVVDALTKNPIPGITITSKRSNENTTSDTDGRYQIAITNQDTLVFSLVGYEVQIVPVNREWIIDIELQPYVKRYHETLICSKILLEPELNSSTYFPYGVNLNLLNNNLNCCCNIRYKLIFRLLYGTDFNSNEIFQTRIALNYVEISKSRIGMAMDYNRLKITENKKDSLISDYRFNLILDKLLKYFSCEFGLGKQTYNNVKNIGLGGKIYLTNDLDISFPKYKFELYSVFWYWKTYNEYSLGLNLYKNFKTDITQSAVRRIKLGCELKQIERIRFVTFSLGINFTVKKQSIGCN